jgi:hypothetical protein
VFREWLKDLWKETWARGLFLIGLASNLVTFFFPRLQSQALRDIAFILLAVGFLWANFNVYKRLRTTLRDAEIERDFTISLSSEGRPPSPQFIKVKASESVTASAFDYLLSDETCIASETVSLEGESFDVPLSEQHLLSLWNTPRIDRNVSDGSGPVKVRLTISIAGKARCYILPVFMSIVWQGSNVFRKVTGQQVFQTPISGNDGFH